MLSKMLFEPFNLVPNERAVGHPEAGDWKLSFLGDVSGSKQVSETVVVSSGQETRSESRDSEN